MPPKFAAHGFEFPGDVPVPVHEEGWPQRDEVMPDAYRIEELDGFDSAIHITAANIESLEQAILLKGARAAVVRQRVFINRGLPMLTYSELGFVPVNWRNHPELLRPGL